MIATPSIAAVRGGKTSNSFLSFGFSVCIAGGGIDPKIADISLDGGANSPPIGCMP